MPLAPEIIHGSVQEALLIDAQRLNSLPRNDVIDAAGGLDALRQVLQMPEGFMPAGITGLNANRVTQLLPDIQSALGAEPIKSGAQYSHPPLRIKAIQTLFPEWYESVADGMPAWQRRLGWIPLIGWVLAEDFRNEHVLKQFPEFVRSKVGATAVREAISPIVAVADIAERFEGESLREEASRAVGLIYEDGWRPYSADRHSAQTATDLETHGYAPAYEVTATGLAQGVTRLWMRLLSQDPAVRDQLPGLSRVVAERLDAIGVDPHRLANSNITVPTPGDIAPFMRELLNGWEAALPGSVEPQVLVSLEEQRYGRVRALLSDKRDLWRQAIQRTLKGLGKLAVDQPKR